MRAWRDQEYFLKKASKPVPQKISIQDDARDHGIIVDGFSFSWDHGEYEPYAILDNEGQEYSEDGDENAYDRSSYDDSMNHDDSFEYESSGVEYLDRDKYNSSERIEDLETGADYSDKLVKSEEKIKKTKRKWKRKNLRKEKKGKWKKIDMKKSIEE